ncbi:phytanoyl-CoA dioxygenase family protein [Streptomyces sp. G44]|uniref:phytanoyl-CoA dioxygenase family protein n=1 Tax=Streptomyces sp. G44 TaxID=2807632 RepID=UPI0019619A67|nr:phytanoyl-CoA dioxygenase family protein [Streptomyces sp. G44]MBM7167723.1 phytanoyl-CoA dioxygenase family protein [Streptomyces sp. G44]
MPNFDPNLYNRDGFHPLPGLLAEADVHRAVEFFDRLDGAAEVPPSYEAEYDEGDGLRRLRKLRRLLWNDPQIWGPLLNRAGVPALAREVIGEDAAVVFHAAFLKPALVGTEVALHQDQALWSHQYPKAFSVWFALTEVSPANGGLFGSRGSHGGGHIPHRARPSYRWHDSLDAAEDGLDEPVQFRLAPGDGVMWDRYFAHGSAANTSPRDRRGMVVVLADASSPEFRAKDSFPLADLAALGAG